MKPLTIALLLLVAQALRAQRPDSRFPVAQLREDFDSLYAALRANHAALYAQRSKVQTDRVFLALRRQINRPLTRLEFGRLVSPFLAGFRDGHTYLDVDLEGEDIKAYDSAGGRFFPLPVAIVEGRVLVAEHGIGGTARKMLAKGIRCVIKHRFISESGGLMICVHFGAVWTISEFLQGLFLQQKLNSYLRNESDCVELPKFESQSLHYIASLFV